MIIKNQNVDAAIERALDLLLDDTVVAIPTETVYGLAASMNSHIAVNEVYSIKGRPLSHPLIVHIADKKDLYTYCTKVPCYVTELIKHLWPGPVTFILKKTAKVPDYVTGGQETVAIRMPAHTLTLKLINKLGSPIVAPSANKFKGISPTRPEHVVDEFGGMIDILDGGECDNGLESTIVDATQEECYKILRPGFVTSEQINAVLKKHYSHIKCSNYLSPDLKFPGNCLKHYSPKKALLIFNNQEQFKELLNKSQSLYVICHNSRFANKENYYKISSTPTEYAKHFYHALRLGDNSNCDAIAIEAPPANSESWLAIWDRLNKASSKDDEEK